MKAFLTLLLVVVTAGFSWGVGYTWPRPPCPTCPKCEPKQVWTAPSTEELGRMYRARVRMERVK
jgi:hypothetical protein